ncbi:hypothetical protein SDRG_01357 [Saprolegnia diclina VS20]|uniref:HAT C-terminal dimerisation domain-containing protein n=1 Tax=Saprolegnia diclina (strain VS20) TaxID=1156394 RepID=T0R344_SAPDV|nr:hypothetical protein SDRG_01357 [Saprolegnia diclina VS20]EQC41386.1 hypothetical protein SDRG_01357 [Saprolegnia diclina VS20]|eukprot:XP_008605100.1 hypothetical protein SDRG_01357 [Saprolegnia diclina VS20]
MEEGLPDRPRASDEINNLKARLHASLVGPTPSPYVVKANLALKKSECWQRFGHVYHRSAPDDLVKLHDTAFVACYVCHTVYSFKSKNGTTTIMAHRCPHERKPRPIEPPQRKMKNPELDALKKEIHHALVAGDEARGYTLQDNPNGIKSGCWKKFGHVFLNAMPLRAFDSGFVACRDCYVVYQYKVRNGTSTMTTHTCDDDALGRVRASQRRPEVASLISAKRARIDALDDDIQAIRASLVQESSAYALLPHPNERKAPCWERFGFVYRHGELVVDTEHLGRYYVGCYACKSLFSYAPGGSTALLLEHSCGRPLELLQETFAHAFLYSCCESGLDLDLLGRESFQHLLQATSELGRATTTSIRAVIPDVTLIRAKMQSLVEMARAVLSARLAMVVQDGVTFGLSVRPLRVTVDDTTLMLVAVHYIDADFGLHHRVLDVVALQDSALAVHETLASYNLSLSAHPDTMVCAPSCSRIPPLQASAGQLACPINVLYAVLTDLLRPESWRDDTTETFPLLRALVDLVTHMPAPGYDARQWTLPLGSRVSWQTMQAAASFTQQQWASRSLWYPSASFSNAALSIVSAVHAIASVFAKAVEALEAHATPMLHTVCYWKHALTTYCAAPALATDEGLRLKVLDRLQAWSISSLHVAAALLDPGQRKRLPKFGIDADTIALAKDDLRTRLLVAAACPSVVSASAKPVQSTPPSLLSMYGDSSDDDDNDACSVEDELRKYFESPLLDETTPEPNVLQWWKLQRRRFPILARVARSILCLPTSAQPTVSFASSPSRDVANLVFLKSNRDLTQAATTPLPRAADDETHYNSDEGQPLI